MPKRYFSIPLGNNADLMALQDYLKTQIVPEGVTWQDPATFHITLVFVEDAGDADLGQTAAPSQLPAFGAGGDFLTRYRTPEGFALVLEIQKSPQLIYLQAALFYALRAMGLPLSPLSWPGLYRPHITLASLPRDNAYSEYLTAPQTVHLVVDRFELGGEGFETLATFPLLTTSPTGEPIQEMQQAHDVMVVWELRGKYPDVPTAPDVDVKALVAGDPDPMFLTLPIGQAGVISGNRRLYGEDFVQELERQVLAEKPIGLMGHLREEDRATEFPAEAVHWVGARRVGELLWAKGYIPPGEPRDRIRRYKAQNKKIATSIDAFLEAVWDKDKGAYRVLANTVRLNQIDLAPADRAGIPDLAVVPHLSSEMAGHPTLPNTEDSMDKDQVIREMTADDARHLPPAVREAVLADAADRKLVVEMRQALGLDEKADLKVVVTEMSVSAKKQREAAVAGRIKELVEDPEKGVKLVAMRGVVTELVQRRNPQTPEEAEKAFAEVVESEAVKGALQETVQRTMGPAQGRPVAGQPGQARYFNIPEPDAAPK
mgnify:FL=1